MDPYTIRLDPVSRDRLMRMMVAEAGSLGVPGMAAVADTVFNRVSHPYFREHAGGDTIDAILTADGQFEPWSRYGRDWENFPGDPELMGLAGEALDSVIAGTADLPFEGSLFFQNRGITRERGTDFHNAEAYLGDIGTAPVSHSHYGAMPGMSPLPGYRVTMEGEPMAGTVTMGPVPGQQAAPTAGLLAPSQPVRGGLLGQDDQFPLYGILGLASGLLEAGAPSVGVPRSAGAGALRGAMQGMQMDAAQQMQQMQRELMEAQIQNLASPQFQTMQLPGLGTVQIGRDGQIQVLRPEGSPTYDSQTRQWIYPPGSGGQATGTGVGPSAGAAPGLAPAIATQAGDLRRAFVRSTDFFPDVASAYMRVQESAQLGTGAGDMGLTIGVMKILDPNSVVREGEYATVQNTAGLPAIVQSAFQRVMSGESLTPEQRRDLLQMAEAQYGVYEQQYDQAHAMYEDWARQYNLDPALVVTDRRLNVEPLPGALRPQPSTEPPPPLLLDPRSAAPVEAGLLGPDYDALPRTEEGPPSRGEPMQLPYDRNGGIDASALVDGQIYRLPHTNRLARWDAESLDFVEVSE